MTGKRVPDGTEPHLYEPGDYGRWKDEWFIRCPIDTEHRMTGNLSSHDVVEHEDGTITVSPSILTTARWAGVDRTWHGYLERGVWREV